MESFKYYSALQQAMVTTIQVSEELKKELHKRKMFAKETYEDIIWGLLEDTMGLSKETLKDIKKAESESAKGQTTSLEQVKKEFKIK